MLKRSIVYHTMPDCRMLKGNSLYELTKDEMNPAVVQRMPEKQQS